MVLLTESDFDKVSRYWKPIDEQEYQLIEFGNWTIEDDQRYGAKLKLEVFAVDQTVFRHPKEFSTRSNGFIQQIQPIIMAAQEIGTDSIFVALKKSNNKYEIHDRTQEILQQAKTVVPTKKSYFGVKGV